MNDPKKDFMENKINELFAVVLKLDAKVDGLIASITNKLRCIIIHCSFCCPHKCHINSSSQSCMDGEQEGNLEHNQSEIKQEKPMNNEDNQDIVFPGHYVGDWQEKVKKLVASFDWKFEDFQPRQGNKFIFKSTIGQQRILQLWAKNDGYRMFVAGIMKKSIEKMTWNKLRENLKVTRLQIKAM